MRVVLMTVVALALAVSPIGAQNAKEVPQLNTLVGALTKALVGTDAFTLFAPTDEAFANSGNLCK